MPLTTTTTNECDCEHCLPFSQASQAKARVLLESLLTDAQRKEFLRQGGFTVKGSGGGTYFIEADGRNYTNNVYEMKHRKRVRRLCAHPSAVPTWDMYVAQKLMLETDERKFRKIAAGHYYYADEPF